MQNTTTSKDYKVNRYFFLAIILALAFFLMYSLAQFFIAFLLSIIFYILGRPLFTRLIKKSGWRKSMAAILIIIVSFFIILVPIIVLVSLLYNKIAMVIAHPQIIMDNIKGLDTYLQQKFNLKIFSDKNLADVQSYATGALSAVLNTGLNFFTTIIMTYFF